MAFVRQFRELTKDDIPLAGGKGANLGELSRIGMPVPPGFVITTAAYEVFRAQQRMPHDVERSILAAYAELGSGAVAVRSSATAEDLPDAAFAGQQETFLNVVGDAALLDDVQRVWASLWSERAVAYRARLGIDDQEVRIAVVVQRMVAAEAAGVLFTANTISGARDEILIDASPGLGEAVVSGEVTPDHFVLRRRFGRWRVVERRAGRREVIIRARAGGGVERVTTHDTPITAVLPDRALRQLAELGARIQKHYGRPQDIEWAWAEGRPFILQARPITALAAPPPRSSRLTRLINANYGEIFAVRPYPLDLDTWIPALAGAIEPMFELVGARLNLHDIFEVEDAVAVRIRARLPRPTWRMLLAPVRLVRAALRYDALQWQEDPLIAEAQLRARAWESRELHALTWHELLGAFADGKAITRMAAGEIRRRYFVDAVIAMLQVRVLLRLLGRTTQAQTLLARPETKTIEVNRALEQMAQTIRSDPQLARAFYDHEPNELWHALEQDPAGQHFLMELGHFLDRYGHREAVLGTALQPTWKDAPEVVLGILKGFAAHERAVPAVEKTPHGATALSERVRRARMLYQIREDTHFYATLSLPLFRRVSLELGRRLKERGVLADPADVFHLTLRELESVADPKELRAAVERRKQKRAQLEGTPLIDPRLFSKSTKDGDAIVSGMPGSPGIAEGPVRVLRSNADFGRLRPGDVLVAPYTNPSWTPLFQRAAAVVVDSGSVGSHAAIVAREYGIPAVMGTGDSTTKLQDGEIVRVDGTTGQVFLRTPRRG